MAKKKEDVENKKIDTDEAAAAATAAEKSSENKDAEKAETDTDGDLKNAAADGSTGSETAKAENEPAAKTQKLAPVELEIKQEHLLTPHQIELRRDENGYVNRARVLNHSSVQTIGAKTVEHILLEAGAKTTLGKDEKLCITFSPYNGEVIRVY